MTTTYCTDADVAARDPYAAALLPDGDAGSFDRLRVIVHDNLEVYLRTRGLEPGNVVDTIGVLKRAEILGVLAEHYHQCASREAQDMYRAEGARYQKAYRELLASSELFTSDDDVGDLFCLTVERG